MQTEDDRFFKIIVDDVISNKISVRKAEKEYGHGSYPFSRSKLQLAVDNKKAGLPNLPCGRPRAANNSVKLELLKSDKERTGRLVRVIIYFDLKITLLIALNTCDT